MKKLCFKSVDGARGVRNRPLLTRDISSANASFSLGVSAALCVKLRSFFFSHANYRFNVHGRWVRFHGSPQRWIKLFNSLERFVELQSFGRFFFRNTVTCRDRCRLRCDVCASGDVLINSRKNVCLLVTICLYITVIYAYYLFSILSYMHMFNCIKANCY